MEHDVFQVNHRHVVFTIDEGLREVFLLHREKLLKEFMDEAVRIIKEHFEKKHKVTPGIIAGLHTFRSRLNFNPHVHMLVTMGGRRRPAIAVSRIEEYDGEMVTFRYRDETDGEEKREVISVEEFIGRLIRHIPDENFKTICYYEVYSRRIKSLCKKLVSEWQKAARR
ncbi:transposase [Paenibacillus sp. N3.4]|uniref:transposase n=1 Tax=Paenibacillus sp. N3.4 TaxID=2603222 RepID=UPI0021C380CD|nr:transposase [Paenibacillus sp. N3.4]